MNIAVGNIPTPGQHFEPAALCRPFLGGAYSDEGRWEASTSTPADVGALVMQIRDRVQAGPQTVELNGVPFSAVAAAGDDRDTVAATLVGLINGGAEPLSAVARPHGEIEITGDDDGSGNPIPFGAEITAGQMILLGELVQITASIQPTLSAKDLELLPEGLRGTEALKFYTNTVVRQLDEQTGRPTDVLEWVDDDGVLGRYEVYPIDRWRVGQLNHSKALAVRLVAGSARC